MAVVFDLLRVVLADGSITEGNEVQLSLSDDGAGLDIDRIQEKAIERAFMGADTTLTEAEIADFIFHAGFSTAAVVSQLAGRGVGMDVVRSEVARARRAGGDAFHARAGHALRHLSTAHACRHPDGAGAGRQQELRDSLGDVEQVMQLRQEKLVAAYASRQIEWQDRHYPFHYLSHLLGYPTRLPNSSASPDAVLAQRHQRHRRHVDENGRQQTWKSS